MSNVKERKESESRTNRSTRFQRRDKSSLAVGVTANASNRSHKKSPSAKVQPVDSINQKALDNVKNEGGENSDQASYQKSDNRELKLRNVSHEWHFELEQAREYRKRNKLCDTFDAEKEILSRGYEIKKIIGSGSYAHVFNALDLNNNKREVALKLIERDKCSKHYREYFLSKEIHVIRRLNHENIVKFYEAFNTTYAYVMVMELVGDGTFTDYLQNKGAFSEKLARKLFYGVCQGLNYMHRQYIAHRDLKLENLLLTFDQVPKISDFSLSVIWDGKNLCTDWCGTPPYFAPEILQKKAYNPLCYDVWSLGVCLFVMVDETVPFFSRNNDDKVMLQKQLNREWKFHHNNDQILSANLKNLLKQMLEPDPSQRISIQEVIASRWLASSD